MIQKLGKLLAHGRGIGFFVAPREVGQNAFEGFIPGSHTTRLRKISEGDLFCSRAIENDMLGAIIQLLKRRFNVEVVKRRQALQHLKVKLVASIPAFDGAGGQT